ncbi:MAG: Rpn family recombination-promoting nuclease/putative transposase [Bacteroidota bacterium]
MAFFAMAEQQRDPERFMPLRMGKYDIGTFEDCFRQNCKHLPMIVYFVFYNGHVPRPYSAAFDDYCADPALGAKHFHIAPFILINIPEYRLEMIQEDKELEFCSRAFYASTQPDPLQGRLQI